MDDDAPGRPQLGLCSECGRPLPAGTMRYCVHCGAEVAGDHRSRHVGVTAGSSGLLGPPSLFGPPGLLGPSGTERPGATWATGEFRAPSPLDGVTELPPVLPPAPGDAWYSDAWYAADPALPEPAPAEPVPAEEPVAAELVAGEPVAEEPVAEEPEPFLEGAPIEPAPPPPFVPPPLAPPLSSEFSASEFSAPQFSAPQFSPAPSSSGAFSAASGPFSAAGGPWPPEPVWPGAPQQPADPPALPLGDAARLGWPPQAAPEPAADRSARIPVLPVAAAALMLVVVTTFGLLWLNSRTSGEVTASQAAPSRTVPAAAAAGTVGSAADVSPSASPGAASPSGSGPAGAADATAGETASVLATSEAVTDAVTDAAAALDALLDESETARGDVASTAVNLQSCRVTASQAAATFRRAGDERARLATEATAIPAEAVAAVPGGGDAVRAFIALQRSSARADEAFAEWAGEVQVAGCRGQARHTANWVLANRYSGEASFAKARFVRLWNPIAARKGLQARSADAI